MRSWELPLGAPRHRMEQSVPTPEPPPDHEESSFSRQRGRPIRGCIRLLGNALIGLIVLLLLMWGGGWYYVGSPHFARLVKERIERNLEWRLGREVTIGRVVVDRGELGRVLLQDVRVANLPEGAHPYFATVREVEIEGGIGSFRTRTIHVGRVDVREPRLNVEIFPAGAAHPHNFPRWRRSEPRRTPITRFDVDKMFISGGIVELLDHRHDFQVLARAIASEVDPTIRKGLYTGVATTPSVTIRFRDYAPFTVGMRSDFDYRPGALVLERTIFQGRGMEIAASGTIEPLTRAVYDFDLEGRTELARVREIFAVEQELRGLVDFEGHIEGEKGDFRMTGDFSIPTVVADTYEIDSVRGSFVATETDLAVDVAAAEYGGGTLEADYRLPRFIDPYAMTIDLAFTGVSIEKLFADWEVENTGLRGRATGTLAYGWDKADLLGGSGRGSARLDPGAVAFGEARYPIRVSGATDFAIDAGVIQFAPSRLQTPASRIAFRGSLRIEDLVAGLDLDVTSADFAELDRIAFNFAQGLEIDDFELLGFGGSGRIVASVDGPLAEPRVAASISGENVAWSEVVLGAAEIALRYDGGADLLRFEPAVFRGFGGSVVLRGTIAFPENAPGPRFDLVAEVENYPAATIVEAIDLDLRVFGSGTGVVRVTGTPDQGEAVFEDVRIARDGERISLSGLVAWMPGEGNVRYDLDIGATAVPIADIAAFLDLGELPVTGELTGTLHIEGPKDRLEGAGAVTIREGAIFGEPVELARAELEFHEGVLTARAIEVQTAAGVIRGEATLDLAQERFSYTLEPTELHLSQIEALSGIAALLGRRVRITSSGAGPFEQPDLLIEAVLADVAPGGEPLPEGTEPPRLYIAMRNGQLRIMGSAYDALQIEGTGTIAPDGALDGAVQIVVADLAQLLQIFAPDVDLDATGRAVVQLQLGGATTSLETLEIVGTIPVLQVTIADTAIVPAEPIRFVLDDGRIDIESFEVSTDTSRFSIAGGVSLTGDRAISLRVDGLVQAAFLQLFLDDTRVEGRINVAASVAGTLDDPQIRGTAEIQDAELRLPGFPQLIDEIRGTIAFRGERIEIDSLTAVIGGGRVVTGGFVALDGLTPARFRATVQGTDVALRYFEGLTLEGDFDLVLTGDLERSLLQGEVLVDRALYYRDFDVTSQLLNLILERRVIGPEIAAGWQDNVSLRVDVSAPETLAVRNNIADITGSAEVDVRGTLANPVILGDITINEGGTIEFQDQEYRVVRGTVTFQNPFTIDPYFDITAEARRGEYDLTINLTGTFDRITPTITSDPPTSDLTLLSLIAPQIADPSRTDISRFDVQNLGAAGGSLLFQTVGELIGQRIFPFADAFRLDTGTLAETEPRVTFEKRVSDELRAILVYFYDSEENMIIVEWQVTPDWMLQFVRDTRRETDFVFDTVDARFRRRYEGHWFKENEDTVAVAEAAPGTELEPLPQPDQYEAIVPLTDVLPQPVVASTDFAADAPVNVERLAEIAAPIAVGEPLSLRDLQTVIKALYGTGDFGDVRADAAPAGEGTIALRFLLSLNYRIREIQFNGLPFSTGRVENDVVVDEGDVLILNAVDRSAEAVADLLRRRGWIEATVDPEVEFTRRTNSADVTFHVNAGPRAQVAAVEFEGELAPFTPERLIAEMRQQPGATFDASRARRDAERILDFLVEEGYRRASTRFLERLYDEEANAVTLRYAVDAGVPVEVRVTGVERRRVRRLLPFRGDEPYSEDLVDRAAEEIRDYFQSRGFAFATVDVEEEPIDGTWVITYQVEPGQRYELARVEFAGNEQLDDERLREAIATARPGGIRGFLARLFRRPTGFTDEMLSDDVESLEALYRIEGFTQAEVARPDVRPIGDNQVVVSFPIQEGPRTIVSEVRVEGNESYARDRLPTLDLDPGDPLDPRLLYADRIRLMTFYGDRGHIEVQVSQDIDYSDGRTSAAVTYQISEGPPVDIGQVVVRGNTYTETDVILNQAQLETGDPFSYRSRLEAQRELYRLGIFNRVDIFAQDAGATVGTRNVVIDVEEGNALSLGGSLGFSDEFGGGGSVSLSHRNLFGTARFLGLEARYFEQEQRYLLTYREPTIFDSDIPLQITIFQSDEHRRGVRFERIGTFIEASRVLAETFRWSLRYEYRRVDCTEVDVNDPDFLPCGDPASPIEEREVEISSITPTVFLDRRDDQINPTDGWFASSSLEYAFPLFAADSTFLKGFTQGAWYRPLGGRSTLAVSARVGLIHRLTTTGPGSIVPFPERFTAGGESSHRGFELDRLGIICDGTDPECEPTLVLVREEGDEDPIGAAFPLGGNAMLLANVEYRFPIFGQLQGAAFVDAGNVWRQIDLIDFEQVRYGAGAGLRYLTPLGPVRFDVGWNLDPEPWEEDYVTFLTIGFAY
ncbi:MAG: outer membrane protein assembly factor BamA [Thermoanaerobaculia bacterium]